MKIVVDKKIKKFDGDVEDLLQTSEIVTESEDIQVIERNIDTSSSYVFSIDEITCFYVVSDKPITVTILQQGSIITDLSNTTEYSFTGTRQSLEFTLSNESATEKAKIKVVMVV